MTLEELYREYPLGTKLGVDAQRLILQTNWFLNALEFDPVTGEALPMALSDFLERILRDPPDDGLHDRLWKIVQYSEESFRRIVRRLNEQPRTEHARMHVARVREMDAFSFMKLANRTGRTIREKLALDPYITSVRHFQSVDIAENRLLKAYATRMDELLSEREKAFDRPEPFLVDLRKWLRTDDAMSISRWNNIPPNNVLLSHRDYRRIWNAWRWLQALDDDIERDRQSLLRRQNTMDFWERVAAVFSKDSALVADIPLLFDFDDFNVRTMGGLNLNFVLGKSYDVTLGDLSCLPDVRASSFVYEVKEEAEPVCIDLLPLEPVYACGKEVKNFGQKLVWQRWSSAEDEIEITPLSTKGIWLNEQALTVTAEDLFVAGDKPPNALGSAARNFCSAIRRRIPNPGVSWLVPDCSNDFELGELRRAVNSCYREAVPVPRSIATVYQELGKEIRSGKFASGSSIAVIDMVGNRVFATRLVANEWGDGELKERVPETGGLFWVRHPVIELGVERNCTFAQLESVATFDAHRHWNRSNEDERCRMRVETMRRYARDPRLAGDRVIILGGSPVIGGLRFFQYQKKAGKIPLWRDILPDLSISAASSSGVMSKVELVSAKTANRDIVPLSGYERVIEIGENEIVTLPAGRSGYRFKIFQGAGSGLLRYCAVVSCPQVFPYPRDIRCKLELKYTYGANDPYTLCLKPVGLERGLPPSFSVEWVLVTADDVDLDALSKPDFPNAASWHEIEHFKAKHGETSLIEELWLGVDQLRQYANFVRGEPSNRKTLDFVGDVRWQKDKSGRNYFVANVNDTPVIFREDRFKDLPDNLEKISFDVESRGRLYMANNISVGRTLPDRPQWLRSQLRFPMAVMFAVRRDDIFPPRLDDTVLAGIRVCSDLLSICDIPRVIADEALLFLCYFADRTSSQIEVILREIVCGRNSYRFTSCRKAVGVALCGLESQWQYDLFKQVLGLLGRNDVRWKSPALEALSVAFWRDPGLIRKIRSGDVRKIAKCINPAIRDDKARIEAARGKKASPWELKTAINTLRSHLELMLALLRARGNTEVEVKKLLVPNGSIAQMFEQTIDDHVMPLVNDGIQMTSNLELKVNKEPAYRNTPDLICALKMYLTGDSGADSIVIERNAGGE